MSLPPPWCLLLMQLVRELAPRFCVELGTAFGISTAYQATAPELNGSGKLATFEGSAAWGELAERTVVLDDVNWPQMRRVDDAIGGQPEVSTSLTIGRLGLSVLGRRRSGSP